MKKIFLSLILLTSLAAFGQKQVYFGISGSGISPWITNQNNYGQDFDLDYNVTFSWAGDLDIGIDFSKNFGLKTEVGLAMLGQNYHKELTGDTTLKRRIRTNYLMVPLLFKYRTSGESIRFYLLAGPQFGFLLKAEQAYTKDDMDLTHFINHETGDTVEVTKSDITDQYNSFQLFLRVDAGVEFTVAQNLIIHAGLTTSYGLLDINASDWQLKDKDGNYNPSHNLYGGLNFGIAYAIPIGKK